MANRFHLHIRQFADRIAAGSGGSILIYVIAVMTVFGLLGAAMVAMFSSATMMSTGTPNDARQARYIAESGTRYAVSELRNQGYNPTVINRLNTTSYTLSNSDSFDLNVFGKWFQAAADYSQSSGTITLDTPEGDVVGDFSIPANAFLVNLESYRDSIYFSGGTPNAAFSAQIQNAPDMAVSPLAVDLLDNFQADASQGHRILLAAKPNAGYTFPLVRNPADELQLTIDVSDYFPEENGSFYLVDAAGRINRYFYEEINASGNLTGFSGSFTLDSSDAYLILTERNHTISASASAGGAGAGGSVELATDFRPNITSPQPLPAPPAGSLPPDVSPSDFASPDTATPESAPGAVTVDTGTGTISLGGNLASASGAAFFGGTLTIGGFDVCTTGTCNFSDGIRAFFIFDYTGSGDGFTFTVASGPQNGLDAYGDTGGSLGYAGVSPTGKQIDKPKMAVEFDTYTNSGHNDPDDAAWTNRDMVQFVYWGTDAASVGDDNTHDENTGGREEQWQFTTPWGAIYTKPAVNPIDGSIHVGSLDNYLWSINANGTEKWRSNLGDDIYSSPVIGSDRTVYVGSNFGSPGGDINAVAASGTFLWYYSVGSDVMSSPAIDSNDVLYFGTNTNDNYFYAIDPASPGSYRWRYNLGAVNVDGHVALSPDESTVYFAAPDPAGSTNADGYDNHFLYALNAADGALRSGWPYNLIGPVDSSPRVADDGTIYIGSSGGSGIGHLFALNPDGTLKWRYDFAPTNPRSRPAIGADGTIYIGNDDNYLYAVSDDGGSASLKWRFQTGSNVRSSPLVHDDGSIWFGSDDFSVYAVDADGNQLADFYVGDNVQAELSQGADGTVYVPVVDGDVFAFSPACPPQNIENRYYTSGDLPGDVTVSDSDDWLNSGPWAARVEIARSRSLNARNRYEYTLKVWLRQCKDATCAEDTADRQVVGSYFQDTRIAYDAKDPHLTQTVELCAADHTLLDTFIFGFTQGTGSATQTIDITDTQLGFVRPGDFTITSDPDWP